MSDQITICNVECFCDNDYLEASIEGYAQKYQADSSSRDFQLFQDITSDVNEGSMEIKEKENQHRRLLDTLRELLVILFPGHAESLDTGQTNQASLPQILHKSNGCYMQPMIWNPGGIFKNRSE